MGLISKEIEVSIGNNAKYYENLGYAIPRRKQYGKVSIPKGTKIKVKVEDLPKGSNMKVLIKCDCCEKEYEIAYHVYINHNHEGKTYCKNCKSKVFIKGEISPFWKQDLTQEER